MPDVWSGENLGTPSNGGNKEKQSKNLKYANSGWSHLCIGLSKGSNFILCSLENQVLWMSRGHSSGSLTANQLSYDNNQLKVGWIDQ